MSEHKILYTKKAFIKALTQVMALGSAGVFLGMFNPALMQVPLSLALVYLIKLPAIEIDDEKGQDDIGLIQKHEAAIIFFLAGPIAIYDISQKQTIPLGEALLWFILSALCLIMLKKGKNSKIMKDPMESLSSSAFTSSSPTMTYSQPPYPKNQESLSDNMKKTQTTI